MIKFFKKIRHKLLTESKFSKYLIYAIGEILLVVIGILIALSINNWNDNRKEKKNESKLIMSLNKELISIHEKLNLNLDKNQENFLLIEEYLDEIVKTDEEKIAIISALDVFIPSSVSYPILINILSENGSVSIKNDSMLNALRKLDLAYKKIDETELYLNQLWETKMSNFLSKNNYATSLVRYMRTNETDDVNLIELYDNIEYKNIIALKWLLQKVWVESQRNALKETKKMLSIIGNN